MSGLKELKSMSLVDILSKYPQTENVLKKYGLLAYARTETAKHENLEASALVHAIDYDSLVNDLNEALGQ